MAAEKSKSTRPNPNVKNWTQFDIELIGAAKDKKRVRIFFFPDTFASNTPDISGTIIVVDRYMLKVSAPELHADPMWIQKHEVFALQVES